MSFKTATAVPTETLVSSFLYRNVGSAMPKAQAPFFCSEPEEQQTPAVPVVLGVPQEEVDLLLAHARSEAADEARRQVQAEMQSAMDARHVEQTTRLEETLNKFQREQKKYFSLAEKEVVQLALAIAGRILHREAQVDPLVVAALVRVAIEKLASGSTVTVRVSPEQSEYWRAYRAAAANDVKVVVVEDAGMKPTDCVLETDLGSADFSLETQLKEVEQGFCDLLALRPQLA